MSKEFKKIAIDILARAWNVDQSYIEGNDEVNNSVSFIETALREAYEKGLEDAAKQCEVDWPKGMPAQAIEYRTAEILAESIRSLKPPRQEEKK